MEGLKWTALALLAVFLCMLLVVVALAANGSVVFS